MTIQDAPRTDAENEVLVPHTRGNDYHVAILGSGLAGSSLAAILARNGLKVVLLERSRHPRFALGESVVPEFSFRAKLLAETYDVPEFRLMSNFRGLFRHISARTGIKRNFSFLHHQPNTLHDPRHTCQFQAMTHPLGPDDHIYRADLDEWLTDLAIRYGADYRDQVNVSGVDFDQEGVSLSYDEHTLRAGLVVDATGRNGLLASKVRDPQTEIATDTRTMFTHMTGVRFLREICDTRALKVPSPPDQGTLHHIFDGGWFWVIPFGNHSRARTDLVSVGLTLDRRIHPDNDLPAEEEFQQFITRFPTIHQQFAHARAVRPWVKTGRVQYQVSAYSGDRWCLMPHAGGVIDALFSTGMALTLSGVHQIARAVLAQSDRSNLQRADFSTLADVSRTNIQFVDRVVHGAFMAFRSHALFNAWYRIWAVANYHASLGLVRIWLKSRVGQTERLADIDRAPYNGVLACTQPRVRNLVDRGYELLQRHQAGDASEADTERALFELLAQQDWIPPQFGVAKPNQRHLASFTFGPMVAMIMWGKRKAPADIRDTYYDVPAVFFSEVGRFLVQEMARGLSGMFRPLRGAFFSRGLE